MSNIILDLYKIVQMFDQERKAIPKHLAPHHLEDELQFIEERESNALVAMFHHWREAESYKLHSEETYNKILQIFNANVLGSHQIKEKWQPTHKMSDFVKIEEKCLLDEKAEEFFKNK